MILLSFFVDPQEQISYHIKFHISKIQHQDQADGSKTVDSKSTSSLKKSLIYRCIVSDYIVQIVHSLCKLYFVYFCVIVL